MKKSAIKLQSWWRMVPERRRYPALRDAERKVNILMYRKRIIQIQNIFSCYKITEVFNSISFRERPKSKAGGKKNSELF